MMNNKINNTIPPPMDDQTIDDPLQCPPLKWGIMGCGRISHDFVQALKLIPSASVTAVAARDASKAQQFSEKHKIEIYYGSYDELLSNDNVEAVYVGLIHPFHRKIGEKCIRAKKHLLLEKPMTCNAADAEYLVCLAKENNVFFLEAMWTRFFPAVQKARDLVYGTKDEPGVLGDIVSVQSDFHFDCSDIEEYPNSISYNRKLGGGASFWIASYPIAGALLFYGGAAPEMVLATGQVDERTGVDLQASLSMSFPNVSDESMHYNEDKKEDWRPPINGIASLSFGFLAEGIEETVVVGTKGRLTLGTPCHCPTSIKVELKGDSRGSVARKYDYRFPVPEETPDIKKCGGYHFPNSAGLAYEAAAVARCIAAGKCEAPQYTLKESINVMKVIDIMREQLGLGIFVG